MKISLCVPVTYRHTSFIPVILKNIETFSEMPDEVVFSISEVNTQEKQDLLKKIFSEINSQLKLVIDISSSKKLAGANRNMCINNATNDILIFQDVDDITHPNRISIIKKAFQENEDMVHLTHSYEPVNLSSNYVFQSVIEIPKVQKIDKEEVKKRGSYCFGEIPIHNGSPSFKKSKIGNVRYKEQVNQYKVYEDQDFNIDVLNETDSCYFLNMDLYKYMIGCNYSGI